MTLYNRPHSPFPYGASELKQAFRPYMLRGVAVSSATWIALFFLAAMLVTWLASKSTPPTVAVPHVVIPLPPQLAWTPPHERPAHTAPAAVAKRGQIEPVHDEVVPQDVVVPPNDANFHGEGTGEPDDGSITAPPPGPPTLAHEEERPKIGEFVYTDEPPVLANERKPVYPELAREAGVEGKVIAHILVGKDGRVLDAEIDRDYSIVMLDGAVLEAVRLLRFTPAMRDLHPVMVWVTCTYRFRLHGGVE